jgi:5-methyltetrahydrofolate--homocysteine methyltransferase
MLIIGEKINGTTKRVNKAILEKDFGYIQALATRQVACGADILDINAGTGIDREPEDLIWLVKTVQDVTDVLLCLDSPNAESLSAAIGEARIPPVINSISAESEKLKGILPLIAKNNCPVIALAMDDTGIPEGVDRRMTAIRTLFDSIHGAGIPDERVYVDPLVMTIATNNESGNIALNTVRAVKKAFPNAHITAGASNISFGLPARTYINHVFLTLAIAAGMDSAIMDPTDTALVSTILAAELVIGRDRHCMNFTKAYRAGKIGRSG